MPFPAVDGDHSAQLFPYLSTINIESFATIDGLFARMISSRWKGRHQPHGLKCVELQEMFWSQDYRKTDIAALSYLREQGLEIV